jgi:hypothetical protein
VGIQSLTKSAVTKIHFLSKRPRQLKDSLKM